MLDRSSILVSMNRLDTETRTRIVACLVEGNSVRATCRMTGAAKGTVLKLLSDLGEACDDYQDKAIQGLEIDLVQCDEIWSFSYCKPRLGRPGLASVRVKVTASGPPRQPRWSGPRNNRQEKVEPTLTSLRYGVY